MTFNPGNLPVGYDSLGQWDPGSGVRLPFAAPLYYWSHGEQSGLAQKAGGVAFYGGWNVQAKELDVLKVAPLAGFEWDSRVGDDGKKYDVFCGKSMGFAPFAARYKWDVERKRSVYQVVGLAGVWDTEAKQYLAAGPVILSVKGTTVKVLRGCLHDFEANTAVSRKDLAGGLPANYFYCEVGAVSPLPNFQKAGKEGKQSTVTPPQIKQFEDYTVEMLQAMYVGAQGVSDMMEYQRQCADWIAEWGKAKDDKINADNPDDQVPF